MSFWEHIKNIEKGPEDYKKDLADLVRDLPGVQRILDGYKCGINDFEVGDDGKKFTTKYGTGTLTIWIEDEQYRLEYSEDLGWGEERRYDSKSKIETERITNYHKGTDIVRCVRDKENIERVDVYISNGNGEMVKSRSCDIAAPLKSISQGMDFDIATLNACGGLATLEMADGRYRRYQDCQDFTKRNMALVRQAVGKSNYSQQCCRYDGTVQEMDEKSQD